MAAARVSFRISVTNEELEEVMKVRVNKNIILSDIMTGPDSDRRLVSSYILEKFDLDSTYTVYGIDIVDGYRNYYLIDDDQSSYPLFSHHELFEIVDDRYSRYWIKTECKSNQSYFFPEWAENEMFFSNLIELWEPEIGTFQKYKRWMDDEFRNETIRQNLNRCGSGTLTFEDGDELIKNIKNIYGDRLHSDPWDYLEESVEKWTTSDGCSIVASFPTSEPVILFFNDDIDYRVYEVDSCRDIVNVMAGSPPVMFYLTNSKKEYLLSLEGNSHLVGSGTALAWDFWDE